MFDHDLRIESSIRLQGLRKRSIAIGVVALGLWLLGSWGLLSAARQLVPQWLGAPADIPALHIPDSLIPFHFSGGLSFLFWLLLMGGMAAVSTGMVRRSLVMGAVVVAICIGAMAAVSAPYSRSPLHIFPSQLERDVNGGEFVRPLRWLDGEGSHYASKEQVMYVKAQIALRDSAKMELLESSGITLLKLVDDVLYKMEIGEESGSMGFMKVSYFALNFRAEIIYELDHRVNGFPATAVGIEVEKLRANDKGLWHSSGVMAILSAAVLMLGLLLCRLWWGVRQRISLIDSYLAPKFTVTTTNMPFAAGDLLLQR